MATAIEFDHVGKQYSYQPDRDECQAIFIASCVENAAASEKVSASEMYEIFCPVMMFSTQRVVRMSQRAFSRL